MVSQETREMGKAALESLRNSVRKELEKKALLGQYAIVNRDGKPCRILASEILKEMDAAKA